MSSTSQHTIALFNKLIEGELSPQETEELIDWLGRSKMDPGAAELVITHLKQSVAHEQVSPAVSAMLEAKLPLILNRKRSLLRSLQAPWVRYAAAALVLLFAGMFFLMNRHPQQIIAKAKAVPAKIDIAPGKQGAILTLADGSKVVLDSLGNGVVATQNGAKLLLHNGELAYNKEGAPQGSVTYNMMSTPKGRQFQLVLPDGTKVWLNAASSLRYPTVFDSRQRTVEVTGEAYFEVAKLVNPSTGQRVPFHVKVNNKTEIEVLGTHFNINSYDDENAVSTTLLEGSVRIVNGLEKAVITPGQQAQVETGSSHIKIVPDANVEKVMAWKNGVFDFQDASLEEVMRELQRWYDIDVRYEKGVPKLEFIGRMGRDLSLASVLNGLELSRVHFRIEEGRRLVVLP